MPLHSIIFAKRENHGLRHEQRHQHMLIKSLTTSTCHGSVAKPTHLQISCAFEVSSSTMCIDWSRHHDIGTIDMHKDKEDDYKYIQKAMRQLLTITVDSLNSEVSKQLLVSVQRTNVQVCMKYAIEK